MKLKFDATLDYQIDAINAVVNVFDGQPFALEGAAAFQAIQIGGLFQNEMGLGNRLLIDDATILQNVHKIQEANNIEKSETIVSQFTTESTIDDPIDSLTLKDPRDFSIEMETGTGKTYVYLRTIFELNKVYGFKKFIITVPSIAIREGVLKSIEIMKGHFQTLYSNVPFEHFVYDSKRLTKVRQFAGANSIQIMVINIQSFQKDVGDKDEKDMTEDELKKLNVINRETDKLSGRKPIEFIQSTNPIVIVDEPQNFEGEKSKAALQKLNPLFTLRYSATHKNPYNLLYKLDPVKAYDLRLVKRIEVASVRDENAFNGAYVKLLKTDNKNGIKAYIEIHKSVKDGVAPTKLWVKQGDDLFDLSNYREIYRDGYKISNIDCTPDYEYLEFNQGLTIEPNQSLGGIDEDLMKQQIWETVEQHLKKERALKGRGIKVLSLFFIDRVSNYRIYNDDNTYSLGKFGKWFEEAFLEISKKSIFKDLIPYAVSKVHNGYFSQDKKGKLKDTTGNTADDTDTYSLIMRDKEVLLDKSEPLRFIFSHSALREGWDNPNVFQICTLNETQSKDKKRQEIGRGLRLPVDSDTGERVKDDNINRLTVIANESYKDFAKALQSEFEDDFGIKFGKVATIDFAKITKLVEGDEKPIGQEVSKAIWNELNLNGYIDAKGDVLDKFDPSNKHFKLEIPSEYEDIKTEIIDIINSKLFKNRVANARERKDIVLNKSVQLSPEFEALWSKISKKTRYKVEFDTEKIIVSASKRISENVPKILAPKIITTVVELDIDEAGISTDKQLSIRSTDVNKNIMLPDILGYLQKETELTRDTLLKILKSSQRLGEFRINPQAFMAAVSKEINKSIHEIMLEGIQYELIENQHWEMSKIEQEAGDAITAYLNRVYEVQNKNKAIYNAIEYDSETERKFAQDLDNNEHVKLFVKLPKWFKIDTPIGSYNPDWAFVTERDEKLYFVRETKSTLDKDELRAKENQKISCGKKHFEAIDVDYGVVTSLAEVGF